MARYGMAEFAIESLLVAPVVSVIRKALRSADAQSPSRKVSNTRSV